MILLFIHIYTHTIRYDQLIGRSGLAWYEYQYVFDFSVSSTRGNNSRYALLLYSMIIAPLVSVAYLIIFLKIEPHAFHHFKKMLYLDVFFQAAAAAAKRKSLDSVDRLRSINGSIARDTQSTVHHHDAHQSSIDSDHSLTSISINSRESSLVDADERRKSSFNSNPSLYMFDFIRDTLAFSDRSSIRGRVELHTREHVVSSSHK